MRREFDMREYAKNVRSVLVMSLLGLLLGACSIIDTVGESLSSTADGMTNVTSSTTSDDKSASFIENRFASIRAEAARGEGENLDSLAKLLGETDRADFARFMKARYADLFTDLEQPRDLLSRIDRYRSRRAGA
jgi:Protein of unknown function (DUF3015)